MSEIRNGRIGIAARCQVAYKRWLRDGSGDIEDAPLEVEAGAIAEAERDWCVLKIRDILHQRLPSPE